MKRLTIICILSLLLLNAQCERDPLPQGLETRVFGRVFDELNSKPVTNQKMIIYEYEDDFVFDGGTRQNRLRTLDSTFTDSNGYYDLTFTTSGDGSSYKIYADHNVLAWNYLHDPVLIRNIGSEQEVNVNLLNLYAASLIVKVGEMDVLPINIEHFFTYDFLLPKIETDNTTVTRTIYVSENYDIELEFNPIFPDSLVTSTKASFVFPPPENLENITLEIELNQSDFIN